MPKIKQILPTNLPEIQVNEMRIDNLFLLEDDSIAIIDYESDVKWENHLKYLNYIVRILERYKKEGRILTVKIFQEAQRNPQYTIEQIAAKVGCKAWEVTETLKMFGM